MSAAVAPIGLWPFLRARLSLWQARRQINAAARLDARAGYLRALAVARIDAVGILTRAT